jgi:hypothetical protein
VTLIWAPVRPQQGPYTGRGARTDGLVSDRTRSFLSPLLSLSAGVPIRARAGRLSERDQSAVGVPLLLSQSERPWRWRRMSEATPLQSKWCGKFSAPSGGEALQGAQKGRSARPQQAKRGRRTLRYVEPLSEVRTPLADFFSTLAERSTALCGCERREPPSSGLPSYTGHFSSFHAISQNIHSYRELMMNDSSIRRFSSFPAVLAHWSTFLRIHCWTSANSGEA